MTKNFCNCWRNFPLQYEEMEAICANFNMSLYSTASPNFTASEILELYRQYFFIVCSLPRTMWFLHSCMHSQIPKHQFLCKTNLIVLNSEHWRSCLDTCIIYLLFGPIFVDASCCLKLTLLLSYSCTPIVYERISELTVFNFENKYHGVP